MRSAVISFSEEATEPAENMFVMLIGWNMTVVPEATVDLEPFNAELISVAVTKEGNLKGLWDRVDNEGRRIPEEPTVELDLYDELDRVEVL